MANDSETVREVCAEIVKKFFDREYRSFLAMPIEYVREYHNRIENAYEREMAAKDAEIARLKEEIADKQDDETLAMQCATCRHYERKHHHCGHYDSLTHPSYVCAACWEQKIFKQRKGESK